MLINRINGSIEEKDGDKYLSIAFTDRNSEVLRKYYMKDYMKIKFNSSDDIPLNKLLNFPTITVIIRNIFEKDGKYYPQIF